MPNNPRKIDEQGRFFCQRCKEWLPRNHYDSLTKHASRTYHGIQTYCKNCHSKYRYERNSRPDYVLRELVRKASKRNRIFELEKDWAIKKYKEQDGKCYYTGTKMTFGHGMGRVWSNVSIDRVDSNKSYTNDNCVLCCLGFNLMKTNFSVDEFSHIAQKFITHYLKYKISCD